MITNDKLKILLRVLENGKVMVRDFDESAFKILPDLEKALTFVKESYIKKEAETTE